MIILAIESTGPEPMIPAMSSRVAVDPIECEKQSSEVLGAIRGFIDGLRSAPIRPSQPQQPIPTPLPFTSTKERRVQGQGGMFCGGVSLLAHLNSIGIVKLVNGLQQDRQQQQDHDPQQGGLWGEQQLQPDARLGTFLRKHNESNERKQILYHVIVPLLRQLEQYYAIMDELPAAPPNQQTSSSPQSFATTKTNYKNNKAPPPLGMLSLNDYTNVACLLEFTISITLIPLLEHPAIYLPPLAQSSTGNNLFTDAQDTMHKINKHSTIIAQKRHQSFPKSLSGRISKMILTWGTLYATESHVALYENLVEGEYLSDDSLSSLRQSYQFHRIFQAYNEMTIVASSVGRLLLLDRFRPMLLPRHLSDVYLMLLIAERLRWYLSKLDSHIPCNEKHSMLAALVESEKRTEQWNHEILQSLHMSLLFTPLTFPSSVTSTIPTQLLSSVKLVDCREAALAYRTLLSGGASMVLSEASSPVIPTWLRIRIGQSLTKLALEDVRSVVEVFVASARGSGGDDDGNTIASMNDDVMTGAAARLACALCTEPMRMPNSTTATCKTQQFQEKLCSQFVSFLVVEGQSSNDLLQSRSSVAMHLTLWATIGQLPMETLQSFFVQTLASGLTPDEEVKSQELALDHLTATQSISAISKWLSMAPTSLDAQTRKKVEVILLEPCMKIHGNNTTLVGQVLRMAASFSRHSPNVPTTTPLIEEVGKTKDDFALVKKVDVALANILAFLCTSDSSSTQSFRDQYTIIASELLKSLSSNELDKAGFCFHEPEIEQCDPEIMVYRQCIDMTDDSDLSYMIGTTERRVKCLVRAFETLLQGRCNKGDYSGASVETITSSLFRLALLLHYGRFTEHNCTDESNTNKLNNLVASEKFEVKVAASITIAAMIESCPPSSLLGNVQEKDESDTSVLEVLGLIIHSAAARLNVDVVKDEDDESELFSTVSIVLSLLIALLELGAENRPKSDETFFTSILPSLRILSSANHGDGNSYSHELIRLTSELAEMSSHAMALIIARGEVASSVDDLTPIFDERKTSTKDAILYKLSQAERDLQSSQPPIRAKGVVTLRHIARSLEHRNDSSQSESSSKVLEKNALIADMSECASRSVQTFSAKKELALLSRTLARICFNSFADPESYVYLASIQTLVAIGDVCPSQIIPLTGTVIANGRLSLTVSTADAKLERVELTLNPEQRIKSAEALIFMIRRRGDGIFMYGSSLLSTMLFGRSQCQDGSGSRKQHDDLTAQMIQRQTHLYFTGDKSNTEDDDIDEKSIRCRTGGPVFSMEETDLVRAGAMSVVCELVLALSPITIASYCHILVKLATDAMQLDTSRPVRRVAACLARDLYTCAMREMTTPSGEEFESTCSMAVALVDANEEKLYNVLTRCVSADELAQTCIVDTATQCRSKEAIDIRQELESLGVLRVAAVILLEQSKYSDSIIQRLSV